MFKENYINLLVCLSVLVFLTIACDGMSSVKGYVYDTNNKPLVNATVKFEAVEKGQPEESYRRVSQTDKAGKFDTGFTHAPFNTDLKLTASKEGYKTYESKFTSREAAEKQKKGEEYKIVLGCVDINQLNCSLI